MIEWSVGGRGVIATLLLNLRLVGVSQNSNAYDTFKFRFIIAFITYVLDFILPVFLLFILLNEANFTRKKI